MPLRDVWKNEEFDFSKWMVKEENIKLLNDEIGIQLVPKETEASVGRYSVDILATEDGTNNIAVIENQIEVTDYDHLGKLLTYAAGLNATYIIWVASEIRDEHLSAIEWLNENTTDEVNFFWLNPKFCLIFIETCFILLYTIGYRWRCCHFEEKI